MSGQKTISTSETRIEALQLQSSAYGVTIPIVGGVTRIPGNLIYYNDFAAVPTTKTQGGKGGGTKTQTTTFAYQASFLMALCHGQITSVPRIWKGKNLFTDQAAAAAVITATSYSAYAVPPGGGAVTVPFASTFGANTGVSYSYIFENGEPPATGILAEGIDYVQSGGTYTFLAGCAAVGRTVTINYTYTSTPAANPALSQLGCTLMPGWPMQSAMTWVTSLHPADALSYAGMAYVSAQNYSLGTGAQVDNHTFEVVGPGAYSISGYVMDIDPAAFAVRVLKDGRYGARLPTQYVDDIANWTSYCLANNIIISPAISAQMSAADFLKLSAAITNTGIVWSAGRLKFIPFGDTAASGNGATFTPNTTPVYALTDDAFITSGNEPPVKVTRKPSSKAYNHFRIQFRNRLNNYANEITESKDQADIEANGLRSAEIFRADWICDGNVARSVAQIMLQRSLYVRATFEFSLPWNYGMLEPMDLVTITDTAQGLNNYAVRITQVEERDGDLTFTAEDFALGVASAASYSTQIGAGFVHNYNVAPGSVDTPTVFEAPVSLTTTGLEVYIAAGSSNANWGGAHVWASFDGTNFRQIGTVNGSSRYGTLTSAVGSTFGVTGLKGALTSGSAADSAAYSTLCFIGGATPEYLAYQTATLTGAGAYTLGGLTRAGYSTGASTHAIGDAFIRVDSNIVKSGPLDLSMIGKVLHIKLTSFNVYGGGEESLAAVTDYVYTITGAMVKIPPPNVPSLTVAIAADGTRKFSFDTTGQAITTGYRIKYRVSGSGLTWANFTPLHAGLITQTPYESNNPMPGIYDFGIAAVDRLGNESVTATSKLNVIIGSGDYTDAKAATGFNAQSLGVSVQTLSALIAQNKAEAAQASAAAATVEINNISSDSVLARAEKPTVVLDYTTLLTEQSGIQANATLYGQSATAYNDAMTALTAYLASLSPAYNDATTNTTIVAATFQQKFVDVYTSRQVLENAIAAKAGTQAAWAGVSGAGRPSDFATVGATFGVNIGGSITIGNVSTFIDPLTIGTAQISTSAATDIIRVTSNGTVIGFNTATPTVVASITFTPAVTGPLKVTASGYLTTTHPASPGSTLVLAPSTQIKCSNGNTGLLNAVALTGSVNPYDLRVDTATSILVTAGVSITVTLEIAAQSNAYQATTANIDFICEVIKK